MIIACNLQIIQFAIQLQLYYDCIHYLSSIDTMHYTAIAAAQLLHRNVNLVCNYDVIVQTTYTMHNIDIYTILGPIDVY